MKKYVNIFGWYGVLAILTAYLLLSLSVIKSDTLSYQLLNLSGAIGLIIEARSKKDTQPVVLNIVWAAIALVAVCKYLLK